MIDRKLKTHPAPKAAKSKSLKAAKAAKAKKKPFNATFMDVHGVCPELIVLFDYMADQNPKGSKGVTLGDVEGYADNLQCVLEQLLDMYGPETALADIDDIDEFADLCC